MSNDPSDLKTQIKTRLEEVLDPCSTFTEKPQSIVDLGLVDGVAIEDGDVTVDLLPTNQLCMYIPHMSEEIETRVGEIQAVDSVTVETVADKVWTQDRMTDEAYKEREEYFKERIETHDITPAYDGETWSEEVRIDTNTTDD
ncbi:MAG: metal-sulfur cluster assembly factor [Halobacteriales archaeon]